VNLEQELQALALEWPPTPDLASSVAERVRESAPRRAQRWRRPLAVALAVLVVGVTAVLAFSPGARSALLELFGIKGATVTRVDVLPEVRGGEQLDLGERVSLEDAERETGFRARLPRDEDVDQVWLDRAIGRGAVTVVWCCPRVVLTEFRGISSPYAEKMVGAGTEVEYLEVNGRPGIWIEGASHVVVFRDEFGNIQERPRLARNVLLWEDGALTLRLEGDFTKQRALALAGRIR
jgi:hypothetical protein